MFHCGCDCRGLVGGECARYHPRQGQERLPTQSHHRPLNRRSEADVAGRCYARAMTNQSTHCLGSDERDVPLR